MSDTIVYIGGITLSGFEIPSKIPYGGEQSLKIHKLVGGQRVIDALGQDDMALAWTGRFQGSDAEARAEAIDQMRIAGLPVGLTWGQRSYTVVIQKFVVDWERFYQQPYSISCEVVTDSSDASPTSDATLDDLVDGDMTAATSLAATTTTIASAAAEARATIQSALSSAAATVNSAMGALNSAISTAQSVTGALQGLSLNALAPVATSALSAVTTVSGVLGDLDALTQTDLGNVAGVVTGGFAPDMIATFSGQSALIDQQAVVQQVYSLVLRVNTNINQATG